MDIDKITTAFLIIAPTAMHRMAHEDGECATARGNKQSNKPILLFSCLIFL